MALEGGPSPWIFCQISFLLNVRYLSNCSFNSPCLFAFFFNYYLAVFIEHFSYSGHFVKFLVGLDDRNQEVKRIRPDLEKDHSANIRKIVYVHVKKGEQKDLEKQANRQGEPNGQVISPLSSCD